MTEISLHAAYSVSLTVIQIVSTVDILAKKVKNKGKETKAE